jgi:hypothetical protein
MVLDAKVRVDGHRSGLPSAPLGPKMLMRQACQVCSKFIGRCRE